MHATPHNPWDRTMRMMIVLVRCELLLENHQPRKQVTGWGILSAYARIRARAWIGAWPCVRTHIHVRVCNLHFEACVPHTYVRTYVPRLHILHDAASSHTGSTACVVSTPTYVHTALPKYKCTSFAIAQPDQSCSSSAHVDHDAIGLDEEAGPGGMVGFLLCFHSPIHIPIYVHYVRMHFVSRYVRT